MRLPENRRNRIRRSDQHDRFGVRGPHRVDCPSHLGCLPRIRGSRDWLGAMRFQRCFHSLEDGSAKGIFGINHADFLVPKRAPQALHLLARFVKVRSARTSTTQWRKGTYRVCAPVKRPTRGILLLSAIGRYFTAVGVPTKNPKVKTFFSIKRLKQASVFAGS